MERRRFRVCARAAPALALLATAAPGPTVHAALEDFTGTYTGTWNNTTFQSSGAARIVTEIDGALFRAAIDMDGNVYGQPDQPEIEIAGTIVGGDAVFSMVSAGGYGTVDGTIDGATGEVDFSITGLLMAGIEEVTATGSFGDGTTLALDYAVDFAGPPGPPAVGTLTVVKVPEPASGIGVAAATTAVALARRRRVGSAGL